MFSPYSTMFKLSDVPSSILRKSEYSFAKEVFPYIVSMVPRTVVCVNCSSSYPLKDLLSGDLEEDQCPSCKMWSPQYWKDKPHQEVPTDAT